MDETELIERFKGRDPVAVRELVEAWGDRLLRSAFLLCGNRADAEDLVQDTFVQALHSAHRFKGRSSLRTWLHAILLNVTRHYRRKRGRIVSTDTIEDSAAPIDVNLREDAEFTASALATALKDLSPAHREVLVLRFYENLKLHEIAGQLDVSPGTVKSRLHYAMAEMRKVLPAELNLFGTEGTNTMEKR